MNKRDQKFFDENWKEWAERNPPPDCWVITKNSSRQWARYEMPCRGFLGRFLFRLSLWLSKKK